MSFDVLFTVISILVLLAVITYYLTAAAVREPAATLFDGFDHFCSVASAATQGGTIVRMQASSTSCHRAERGRCLEVEQLVVRTFLEVDKKKSYVKQS